ncbi:MAG: hypothetical protein QM704_17420 [Anaeromyxobacteraceae bacterium]
MGKLFVVAAAAAIAGCTSVRLVQRDGCWIQQTTRAGAVHETLGPCAPPATAWSEDRPTRLVQECGARAEQRWRARAAAAFQRGAPPPEGDEALEGCITEASRIAGGEVEDLRRRLAQAEADRDAHRNRAEHEHAAREEADRQEREALQAGSAKLADWLGQAAVKASPPATATALSLSDGRALSASQEDPPALASEGWPELAPPAGTAAVKARVKLPLRPRAATPPPACEAAPAKDAAPVKEAAPAPAAATPARAR